MEPKYFHKNRAELIAEVFFFETTGFSMWPFLKAGEKLIIKKTSIDSLGAGDIVLYTNNNQIVCHRLIKKIKQGYGCVLCVRGDNCLSLPEQVTKDKFLGKAIGIVKKEKIISLNTIKQHFLNRMIVIAAPLFCRMQKLLKIILLWWRM